MAKLGLIVRDLTALEVNTIVSSGISARPMKNPRHALYDIGRAYREACKGLVERFAPELEVGGKAAKELLAGIKKAGGSAAFDMLDKIGSALADATPKGLEGTDRITLLRISTLSAELRELLKRCKDRNEYSRAEIDALSPEAAALGISPEDLVTLRKLWEIKTETVVMQTVIDLSGDVTTRVKEELVKVRNETLHHFHNQGVSTALQNWHSMVTAAKDFATHLLGLFRA